MKAQRKKIFKAKEIGRKNIREVEIKKQREWNDGVK
jgi:hypothetical protein